MFDENEVVCDGEVTFDPVEIEEDRIWCILGYICPIIIFIKAYNSKHNYCIFHANQCLLLFICTILTGLLSLIPAIGTLLYSIACIFTFIITVIGVLGAVNKQAKRLPIIGNITIWKY